MAKEGVPVCETDEVGHSVLKEDDSVRAVLIAEWGAGITGSDGGIDRVALGRLVFADPAKRERLNSLIHPAILKKTADWIRAREGEHRHDCVVVIIPLLYEIGLEKEWDRVICVASPEADQYRRLTERGLTPEEIRLRLASQMSLAAKMERADHVIYNGGSRVLLEEQTKRIVRTIRGV